MGPFSHVEFDKAMRDVLIAVMAQLEDEIKVTKEWLQANELWFRALIGLDGSYECV